jgi:Immunoglobulin I-set domain
VINDDPDNDVDEDQTDNYKLLGTLLKTSTASSLDGFAPYFSKESDLIKRHLKPSGNMIKMKCPAKGNPDPKWEWTKNGTPIERKLGQVLYQKMAITLEDLIPADNGLYTCKICNIYGCINFTSKLEVSGK